jgi:hypothetical protein
MITMITGKQLKELVSLIPDDAKVGIGYDEDKQGEFLDPELIKSAVVQTVVDFPECEFFVRKVESTIIFVLKGVEQK